MSIADCIRRIDRKFASLEQDKERARSRAYALQYEELLEDEYGNDPDFQTWDRNRALDLQDFDYLFYHRHRHIEKIKTQLELIASKISYVKADGDDGYFKKLEKNVGWTRHITPLVICQVNHVDNLVRCGMWANAKNSRRCHKPDCPCCHWNDTLKVAIEAFGAASGTYSRMQAYRLTPSFITLGFTTNPKNSKCFGRNFQTEDIAYQPGDPEYEPYPVRMGISDDDADGAWLGYEDGKLLGMITQQAIEKVYNDGLLSGYRFKIEGAYQLTPGGANRVNIHAHAVANGKESNPQILAKAFFKYMKAGLGRYRKDLNGTYYPEALVLRLNSAEELERVVKYCEKVTPFGLIVEDAMNQPEAKLEDGAWNRVYLDELRVALIRLVNDDIPAIFSGSADRLFQSLRRRKSAGNMGFNDRGACIGDEPYWHQRLRRKRAEEQREKRLAAKREHREAAAENPVERPPAQVS